MEFLSGGLNRVFPVDYRFLLRGDAENLVMKEKNI
jgi:hypothetical protein